MNTLLLELKSDAERHGHPTRVSLAGDPVATVRPDSFKRCLTNLVANAQRYGTNIAIEAVREQRFLTIHVDDDVPDVVPPSMVQHHLLMILREAVANVFKHARATTLDVSLRHRSEAIDVTIADDGVGFTPASAAPKGHDGLANMRARVAELGGTLAIDSGPGRGTRVHVHLPLSVPAVLPEGPRRL
jgi:signal transduction histidine kinase